MTALPSARTRRRALAAGGVLALVVGAGVIVFAHPFGSAAGTGELDNGAATSTAQIERRDLSSQTQVSATLGYADASTIAVPSGTAPSALQQADQQHTTAAATLATAQATLADDKRALAQARATLAADRHKLAVDCDGTGAAATGGGGTDQQSGGGGGNAPCAADAQAVAADEPAVTTAESKVSADERQVAAAQSALADADDALEAAQASAAVWDQSSVYTWLPQVGDVIRRGGELYAVGGEPVLLLYGSVTPWRAFRAGMSPGRDVAELNKSLGLSGDVFTSATASAIRSLQAKHGLPVTGELLLGAVVFQPGAVRVTSVTPTRGAPVQAGPVLGVTSTRRLVTIALDAAAQTSVKVGDPVEITMPDNSTTPGRVSYVGTVATTASSDQGGGGSSTPTIEVRVTPTHPADTGRLDQAPVDVSITTDTRSNVLVTRVDSLLALASGGYAVEAVEADGTHRLVRVETGLFDDSQGLVEVRGAGIHAGMRVVVPGE